jgi:hypothetical protein
MTPSTRRIVIPLAVLGVGFLIILPALLTPRSKPASSPPPDQTATEQTTNGAANPAGDAGEADDGAGAENGDSNNESQGEPLPAESANDDETDSGMDGAEASGRAAPSEAPAVAAPVEAIEGLHAAAPSTPITADALPTPLGSFDWRTDAMRIEFAANAAGIESVTFSDQWETVEGNREAERVKEQIRAGSKTLDALPATERYVLKTEAPLGNYEIPVLAAHSVVINGERVSLFGSVWSEVGPGRFVTEIRDADDRPVLGIERRVVLADDGYDITLVQQVHNVTDAPLEVQWCQYGPGSLRVDRSRYMDRRRFRFGFGSDPAQYPTWVRSDDNKLLFEHRDLVKRA